MTRQLARLLGAGKAGWNWLVMMTLPAIWWFCVPVFVLIRDQLCFGVTVTLDGTNARTANSCTLGESATRVTERLGARRCKNRRCLLQPTGAKVSSSIKVACKRLSVLHWIPVPKFGFEVPNAGCLAARDWLRSWPASGCRDFRAKVLPRLSGRPRERFFLLPKGAISTRRSRHPDSGATNSTVPTVRPDRGRFVRKNRVSSQSTREGSPTN